MNFSIRNRNIWLLDNIILRNCKQHKIMDFHSSPHVSWLNFIICMLIHKFGARFEHLLDPCIRCKDQTFIGITWLQLLSEMVLTWYRQIILKCSAYLFLPLGFLKGKACSHTGSHPWTILVDSWWYGFEVHYWSGFLTDDTFCRISVFFKCFDSQQAVGLRKTFYYFTIFFIQWSNNSCMTPHNWQQSAKI